VASDGHWLPPRIYGDEVSIHVPSFESNTITDVLAQIVSPGTWLDGHNRRAIAERSRLLAAGSQTPITAGDGDQFAQIAQVVDRITLSAQEIRPDWLALMARAGVSPTTMVEIVGIVARIQAIDTYAFALGVPQFELPSAVPGEPGRIKINDAGINAGWLPTVGRASPPNVLSVVPDDLESMMDLHEALYLSLEQMGNLDVNRGLHRTQMELVAGRTSFINECFY